MNKLLNVKNLTKVYYNNKDEIEAIKDISFDLYEGEHIAENKTCQHDPDYRQEQCLFPVCLVEHDYNDKIRQSQLRSGDSKADRNQHLHIT